MHAEYAVVVGTPIVSPLACSLAATEITIDIATDSLLAESYEGATQVVERTNCNYGLEPAQAWIASSEGLRVVATDDTGEVRAVERTDHPFFVATLYQPQLSSPPAHPLLTAFLRAAAMASG